MNADTMAIGIADNAGLAFLILAALCIGAAELLLSDFATTRARLAYGSQRCPDRRRPCASRRWRAMSVSSISLSEANPSNLHHYE